MNDRQLLELAAKACGGEFSPGTTQTRTGPTWNSWAWTGPEGIVLDKRVTYPLTNDGDAFRLAVKLKMQVIPCDDGVEILIEGIPMADTTACYSPNNCLYDATRRAIVRAAAAIGATL